MEKQECPLCGYRTSDLSVMADHRQRAHEGREPSSARRVPGVNGGPSITYTTKADRDRTLPAKRAAYRPPPKPRERKRPSKLTPLSEVGVRTDAGLACPKCGGIQFQAKRSGAHRLAGWAIAGPLALLATGGQVRCVTCATVYLRG